MTLVAITLAYRLANNNSFYLSDKYRIIKTQTLFCYLIRLKVMKNSNDYQAENMSANTHTDEAPSVRKTTKESAQLIKEQTPKIRYFDLVEEATASYVLGYN